MSSQLLEIEKQTKINEFLTEFDTDSQFEDKILETFTGDVLMNNQNENIIPSTKVKTLEDQLADIESQIEYLSDKLKR